ncbi:helix-turn-helix transcriptional regulator [Streptomyces sp. A7024]|uniref:Helix-turn-helix transcriptional regulator n=1 Tax=Streptomyces coryli TaxID=1128680 RepID=A0A6G4U9N6_9ACTN|nr:helix-turn-helix transcriptional regulator [Streptomyces coryli]
MSSPPDGPLPPPFDAVAARRLREALGMGHEHVAYGIQAAYGRRVDARTIAAWEAGHGGPTHEELAALAGALWCAPADLMGGESRLREHRMAAGLAVEDVARHIGVEPESYAAMEASGDWTGTDRQAAELAGLLRLPIPVLLEMTGRTEKLAGLLRDAATTRWQAYVRQVAKLVPLPRHRIEQALQGLHEDYQGGMVSTLNWGSPGGERAPESGAGEEFLTHVLDHFWERVG